MAVFVYLVGFVRERSATLRLRAACEEIADCFVKFAVMHTLDKIATAHAPRLLYLLSRPHCTAMANADRIHSPQHQHHGLLQL